MKYFFTFFLLFSFIISCHGQPTKDGKMEIQKKIALIKQKHSIDIGLDKPDSCSWEEVYYNVLIESDHEQLLIFLNFIDEEFGKYPRCLWHAAGNPKLILVKDLFYQKQSRGGIPDCYLEILYFDIHLGSYNEAYQRHILHHEFYHMLEQEQNGTPYFKDPHWHKLNEKGYTYGSGGANDRDGNHSVMNHPQMGFINRYSMSGLEEDKAEIYASIWVDSERKKTATFRKDDQILENKYQYMFKQLQRFCVEMNEEFWKKIDKL